MTRPSDNSLAKAFWEHWEDPAEWNFQAIVRRAIELDSTSTVLVGDDTKRLDYIERADYIAMPKGVNIGSCRASIDASMAAALAGD